jgi:hypothetical protein
VNAKLKRLLARVCLAAGASASSTSADRRSHAFRLLERSAEELLASSKWGTLEGLLAEFRPLSVESGITPLIVYIPTKLQVYGRHAATNSGSVFLDQLPHQLRFENERRRGARADRPGSRRADGQPAPGIPPQSCTGRTAVPPVRHALE